MTGRSICSRRGGPSFEAVALAKAAGHWIANVLPLLLASPLLALLCAATVTEALAITLTLVAGTPALSLIGTTAAALGLAGRRGAMLSAVIAIPFALPSLIFGAAAAAAYGTDAFLTPFLLLCATTLFALALAPFATAAALRTLRDG